MKEVIITFARRDPRVNSHEGIVYLGNAIGRWSREQIVTTIESRKVAFYTLANGKRFDIAVVKGPNGKYLRTHANGVWTNNLMTLPQSL